MSLTNINLMTIRLSNVATTGALLYYPAKKISWLIHCFGIFFRVPAPLSLLFVLIAT